MHFSTENLKKPENVVLSGKFFYSHVKYALSFKLPVIGHLTSFL